MKIIKDVIYKHIRISGLALKFIDTSEFQRMRRIKQTSTSYLVYPSACHTRFEHSIGVYYLTGLCLDNLNISISEREKEIIKLAGLLHDIGHLGFSHTFDKYIMPKLKNKKFLKEHEHRSILIIEHINNKYKIGLNDDEVKIIQHCILGEYYKDYPKYYFQIVANKENGIDVDKMDYLLRDSYYIGNNNPFDYSYVLASIAIKNNEISFDEKSMVQLCKMLNSRFFLHNEFYQHKNAIVSEIMISDLILENKEYLKLEELHLNFNWCNFTDDIIYTVPNDTLLQRIYKRDFYKETTDKTQTKIKKIITYNSVNNFFFKINFHNKTIDKIIYDKIPDIFNGKIKKEEYFYLKKD